MKRIEISVNGTTYPCSPTMGAMLRFKKETGKEITDIDPSNFTDLCTFLWCCVVSASKREGIEFNMPLLDFADNLNPEDMEAWTEVVTKEQSSDETASPDEKKSL